jgi:tmRNA-binding protein
MQHRKAATFVHRHFLATRTPFDLFLRHGSILTKWPIKKIVENHAARNKYIVEQELECGIVLAPSEVKSIRDGNCSISSAFAVEFENHLYLHQMYISGQRQRRISYAMARNR